MIAFDSSVCIEATATRVWVRLAALEEITLWSEAVRAARCEGPVARGAGAERTCDLAGGVTIRERWLEWDEGRSFTYEGLGLPLVARATNHWSVEPDGARTLLRSHAEVQLKGGLVGRLLEPLFAWQIRRMTPRTLAAFKHLVEHSEPPAVRHAQLAPAPALC